jgi:hypothetical protein
MAGSSGYFLRSEVIIAVLLSTLGILCVVLLPLLFTLTAFVCVTPFIAVMYAEDKTRSLKRFGLSIAVTTLPQFCAGACVAPSSAKASLLSMIVIAVFSTAVVAFACTLKRILRKDFAIFIALSVCVLLLSSVFVFEYLPFRNYSLIQVAIDLNPFCAVFYGAADYDWLHSSSMYDVVGSYYPFRQPTVLRTSLIYSLIAFPLVLAAFFPRKRRT